MTLPADSGRAAADNGESLRRFRAILRGKWCLTERQREWIGLGNRRSAASVRR
jgi:hypothetical protein